MFFFSLTLFRFVVQECTFEFKQMELLTNAMPALKKILCHRSTEEWMSPHTCLGSLENEKSRCAAPRVFTVCSLISQNNVDRERGCLWTESKLSAIGTSFFFFRNSPAGRNARFLTRAPSARILWGNYRRFSEFCTCVQQSKSCHMPHVQPYHTQKNRLDVEALECCPCPAACASRWRLPCPLAMTHMRWVHG